MLPGWSEAVRSRWPDLRRMCRRSQRRQVCSVLLCQRDLSAVLLWAVLGAYPLRAGPRVPQAAGEGRRRPASRNALPLVLRRTVHVAWLLSVACARMKVTSEFIIVVCCCASIYFFGDSPQSRHVVVASFSTSSYSSLFLRWVKCSAFSIQLHDSLEVAIFSVFCLL